MNYKNPLKNIDIQKHFSINSKLTKCVSFRTGLETLLVFVQKHCTKIKCIFEQFGVRRKSYIFVPFEYFQILFILIFSDIDSLHESSQNILEKELRKQCCASIYFNHSFRIFHLVSEKINSRYFGQKFLQQYLENI